MSPLLTNELLQDYVGGQLQFQSLTSSIFQGEIATITLDNDDTLAVTFAWLAEGVGQLPLIRWRKSGIPSYQANLNSYHGGPREQEPWEGADRQIFLTSLSTGEAIVLFHPNGGGLDPTEVEGLTMLY